MDDSDGHRPAKPHQRPPASFQRAHLDAWLKLMRREDFDVLAGAVRTEQIRRGPGSACAAANDSALPVCATRQQTPALCFPPHAIAIARNKLPTHPRDAATVSVTTMERTFCYAEVFNQNLNNWSTGAVTTMRLMFNGAVAFNQNTNNWNTSAVVEKSLMFENNYLMTAKAGFHPSVTEARHVMITPPRSKRTSHHQDLWQQARAQPTTPTRPKFELITRATNNQQPPSSHCLRDDHGKNVLLCGGLQPEPQQLEHRGRDDHAFNV